MDIENEQLRTRMGEMAAEIERLQSVIDAANAQKPVASRRKDLMGNYVYRNEIVPFTEPLYARPIPAQQSNATALDIATAFCHGLDAAQQSPAVAVPDNDDSVSSIACTLHNYATQLHYAGNEKLADQLEEIVLRLCKCKQLPRITEQDAREIIISCDSWVEARLSIGDLDEYFKDEGHALLAKLNKPDSVGG